MILHLLAAGSALAVEGSDKPFDPNREPAVVFREFLARTPPIRFIAHRRSFSRFLMSVADRPGSKESILRPFVMERLEAGWQPEGWYLQDLGTEKGRWRPRRDGSITYQPMSNGLARVRGRNKDYYWCLYDGQERLSITFRTNTPGGVRVRLMSMSLPTMRMSSAIVGSDWMSLDRVHYAGLATRSSRSNP